MIAAPASSDPRISGALTIARAVARAASVRRESRGAHFRRDFPALDPHQSSRSFVGVPCAAVAAGSS